MDWVYEQGIPYTYGPELRGPFFILDPKNIEISHKETMAGLLALMDEIEVIDSLSKI